MDLEIRDRFLQLWKKYFGSADLPMTFFYTNEESVNIVERKGENSGFQCFLGNLRKVLKGEDLRFNARSYGCPGGIAYCGFGELKMPNFEYFLSCGIEGKVPGERYKRTPELALAYAKNLPKFEAPADYLVFKRWDRLTEDDNPDVVVFWATPDILSGLFTLSNFEEEGLTNVVSPFASGCGSMVMWPYVEKDKENSRTFLGMFDVSARPSVPENTLSFAISFKKFVKIIESMEESFVITDSWDRVKKRIDS